MKPFPIPDYLAEVMPEFSGRTWVLPKVLDWFDNSTQRHFIITGDPGTGKSMFAAWLAGYGKMPDGTPACRQLERLRGFIKGVHFIQVNTGSVSPTTFAKTLAKQLGSSLPEFNTVLLKSLSEQVTLTAHLHVEQAENSQLIGHYIEHLDLGNLEASEAFNRVLRRPLIQLYEEGYQEPILLVVDALDEAYGSSDLVQILSGLSDLPIQVRLLVTTRNDPRLLFRFPKDYRLDLVRDCPPGELDLLTYVEVTLKSQSRQAAHPLPTEQAAGLAAEVAAAAQGNFLYAHLVTGDILRRLDEGPLPEKVKFPPGLAGHYAQFIGRELYKDSDRWDTEYKPVLGVLAVSRGAGLERDRLERIVQIDVDPVLRKCAQYLQPAPHNGPFRLFHRSFAEYLLEELDNELFHIQPVRMHRLITHSYTGPKPRSAWRKLDWQHVDAYGVSHLAAHAVMAGEWQKIHAIYHPQYLERKRQVLGSEIPLLEEVVDLVLPNAGADEALDVALKVLYELSPNSYRAVRTLSAVAQKTRELYDLRQQLKRSRQPLAEILLLLSEKQAVNVQKWRQLKLRLEDARDRKESERQRDLALLFLAWGLTGQAELQDDLIQALVEMTAPQVARRPGLHLLPWYAAEGLRELGYDLATSATIRALEEQLRRPAPLARSTALYVLARWGCQTTAVRQAVLAGLDRRHASSRLAATAADASRLLRDLLPTEEVVEGLVSVLRRGAGQNQVVVYRPKSTWNYARRRALRALADYALPQAELLGWLVEARGQLETAPENDPDAPGIARFLEVAIQRIQASIAQSGPDWS